jgi:hypothetical protein
MNKHLHFDSDGNEDYGESQNESYSNGDDNVDNSFQEQQSSQHSLNSIVIALENKKLQRAEKKDQLDLQSLVLFGSYLNSNMGGALSTADILTVKNRVVKFLLWTKKEGNGESIDTLQWVKILCKERYILLSLYCEYLEITMLQVPGTIKIILLNLTKFFMWCCHHRKGEPKIKPKHLTVILELISRINSSMGKACRHRKSNSSNSLQSKVANRQLPANGLQDLRDAVAKSLLWIETNKDVIVRGNDKWVHGHFLGIFITAMYTHAQGRIGGILDLKADQLEELLNAYYAMTNHFKTRARFGYQAFIIPEPYMWLLRLYGDTRHAIVERTGVDSQWLWIKIDGTREEDMGAKVTAYGMFALSVNLTTTGMRAMMEIEANEAYKVGKISLAEKEAIHNVNGHSSQMTKDYYLYEDMADSVEKTSQAYEAMRNASATPEAHNAPFPQITSSTNTVNTPIPWSARRARSLQPIHWGIDHPNYLSNNKRATWSDQEMDYIAQWYQESVQSNPGNVSRMAARLLALIQKDEAAHRIFHEIHVLNSARLRTGVRAFEKSLSL